MRKEITILAFGLMICLCNEEKGKAEARKELTGSKRIALLEYQKLNPKQRVETFNQLEMANRFELLKAVLPGQSCGAAPDADFSFGANGNLTVRIPEGNFVNKWKIDSTGLTVYNIKKLERLEHYLGIGESRFNEVYWENGELNLKLAIETEYRTGLSLFCDASQLQ
ncbi:hypothetical protein [Leptospira interrogans]|uniref:hypothetical protein n=1 Tax=Leptospira interrogans TaxID=173 RepID=UPI000A96B1AA|nr:hypothetical protein [Leptospira interrogans]